jgi:hypothetical protein
VVWALLTILEEKVTVDGELGPFFSCENSLTQNFLPLSAIIISQIGESEWRSANGREIYVLLVLIFWMLV